MAGAPIPNCPGWYPFLFRCCLCLFECHVFEEELAAFSPGAFCLSELVINHFGGSGSGIQCVGPSEYDDAALPAKIQGRGCMVRE